MLIGAGWFLASWSRVYLPNHLTFYTSNIICAAIFVIISTVAYIGLTTGNRTLRHNTLPTPNLISHVYKD